ncbi:MAG: MFS transporter [Elusimicrobia bacterium]|nr:MFS transporter [Elusimicrobiota bacterium]
MKSLALLLALCLAPGSAWAGGITGVQVVTSAPGVRAAPIAPTTTPGGFQPVLPSAASWSPSLPSPTLPSVAAVLPQAGAPKAAAASPAVAASLIQPAPRVAPQTALAAAAPGRIAATFTPAPETQAKSAAAPTLKTLAAKLSFASAPSYLNAVFDGGSQSDAGIHTPVSQGSGLAAPSRLGLLPKQTAPDGTEIPQPTGLRSLIRTHYFGILHDNAFKTFFSAWVTATLAPAQAGMFVSLATALFTAPYLILSVWAGRLADRTDKAALIGRIKAAELVLAVAGASALALGSYWGAAAVIAAMGTLSAVMSPAKYSLLAERVDSKDLSAANGWIELATFISLIAATAIGGALASWGVGAWASLAFGAAAVMGWWNSRRLAETGSVAAEKKEDGPRPRMPWNLVRTAAAIAFFWLLSSIVQMNIFLFGAQTLGVGTGMVTAMLTAIGLFTGLGAVLAGQTSKDKVQLGVVPLGAIGVALALLDLGLFGGGSLVRSFIDLAVLSVAAGFFYIPLNAHLQKESPPEARGRFLGISNLMTFAAILGSAGLYWALSSLLALSPAGVFTATAGLALAAAALTTWFLRAPLAALFRR